MAIARLSRVSILSPRSEFGATLMDLTRFGQFHPSTREGLVQDVRLLLLGSRAHAVFSNAASLLSESPLKGVTAAGGPAVFRARDIEGLVVRLEESFARLAREVLAAEEADLPALRGELEVVREMALAIFESLERIRVHPGMDRFIMTEGFIPTASAGAFREMLGGRVVSVEPMDKRRPQEPYVPSLLVNSRVVSLFESFSLAQGVPRYSEIDPTPIVAFVFPFFFGIMFGDIGHGTVLLALGLYLARQPRFAYRGRLVAVFGVAALAVGFLRGTFFGLRPVAPLGGLIPLPEALKSGFTAGSVPLLLEVAIIIGTFHLTSAYVIAFLNSVRSGDYREALLGHLPTLVLYASFVPLGLAVAGSGFQLAGIFESRSSLPVLNEFLGIDVPVSAGARASIPVIVVALFILVAGHPIRRYLGTHDLGKTARAFGSGLAEAVAKPFEFLMNTISYVRLGIFLIITSLTTTFATGILALGVPGIPLFVLANAAIMGLEGLMVYVNDLRLHVYEWFSKFYTGTGIPFSPLSSRFWAASIVWE